MDCTRDDRVPSFRGLPLNPFEQLPFLERLADEAVSKGDNYFVLHDEEGVPSYWLIDGLTCQRFLKNEKCYLKSAIDPDSLAGRHTVGNSLVAQIGNMPQRRCQFAPHFKESRVSEEIGPCCRAPLQRLMTRLARTTTVTGKKEEVHVEREFIRFSLSVVLRFVFGFDEATEKRRRRWRFHSLWLGSLVALASICCLPVPFCAMGYLLFAWLFWYRWLDDVPRAQRISMKQLTTVLSRIVGELLTFRTHPLHTLPNEDLRLLDVFARKLVSRASASSCLAQVIGSENQAAAIAEAKLMLLAGSETTATTLLTACHLLARHPERQSWLVATDDDLPASRKAQLIIEGVMSRYPTAPFILRQTVHPFPLTSTQHIPLGTTVYVFTWYLHRRLCRETPAFDQPVLDRFLQSLLFGHGGRTCLGKELAKAEMTKCIVALAENYTMVSGYDSPSQDDDQIPCAIDWSHAVIHLHPQIGKSLQFTPRID